MTTRTTLDKAMSEPNDLDAIAFEEVTPPTFAGSAGLRARCRRHDWVTRAVDTSKWAGMPIDQTLATETFCARCGTVRDEVRARRGKSARSRGNAYERELAKKLGGKRTGMYGGPDDVTVNDLFVIQSKVRKAWPQWMADELAKLPRTGGRIPLLVVANAPGSAFRRRALVVVELGDWLSLHGPTEGVDVG